MKKYLRKASVLVCVGVLMLFVKMPVQAAEETIKTGIYIGNIDVGGMTVEEAKAAVEEYVDTLKPVEITLKAANGGEVTVTAGELGIAWTNPEVLQEAIVIGQDGNVITRYKIMKDLQNENVHFDMKYTYDINAINDVLAGPCVEFDTRAVDATLSRENGAFVVQGGTSGYMLDVESSIDKVYEFMMNEWQGEAVAIELKIEEEKPRGSAEELAQITDVLGSYTTSFATSGASRRGNVINGCNLINGTVLYPGDEFSTLQTVVPFTAQNGYYKAASYANGRVVDSYGGGICQVSTTLYNAVLLAELEVTERYNHSMIVAYVDPSADAAIAESANKDFKFVNNTDAPVYIEGVIENKKITMNIYGKETRAENREIAYTSEVLQVINPGPDVITASASQPLGYITREGAHTGYKAQLWKIVKEDGVEVERTKVNYSSYKATPRYATVGVVTADPNAYNEIMAAIGTANIDHVQNVINILLTPPAAPEVPQ